MSFTVFACGAGKQSAAISILIAEGALPKPNAAIFSDTGWEPAAVYRQVDRIEQLLATVAVPLHRVGRGNLRDDILDPYRQAAIPAFTLSDWREKRTVTDLMPCPEHCGWGGHWPLRATLTETGIDEDETFADEMPLPTDCARCESTGHVPAKWSTEMVRSRGTIVRRCTGRYKVEPIERQIRELLGATVAVKDCRYCDAIGQRVPPWDLTLPPGPCSVCNGTGQRRRVGPVPAGARATQWIGFSTDEAHRVSPKRDNGDGGTEGFPSYITPAYPLLDLNLSRKDCERMLAGYGWGDTVKSACIGCPYRGNAGWRDMRANQPAEWAAAVAFDHQFRTAPGLRDERFLHSSRIPLEIAPIEKVTRGEVKAGQGDMFDELADLDDPDGCSPYGCRSGKAA